jgi:hypothetical protein
MGVWPVLQVFMGVWTILSWEVHSAKIWHHIWSMDHTPMWSLHCTMRNMSAMVEWTSSPCLHWSIDYTLNKSPNCTIWAILHQVIGVWRIFEWKMEPGPSMKHCP